MITYLISLLFVVIPSENVFNEINLEDIRKAQDFHELTHINEKCKVYSFNMVIVPIARNVDVIEVINSSDKLNERSLLELAKVKVGDVIYLEQIKSVADCHLYQGSDYKNYILKITAE